MRYYQYNTWHEPFLVQLEYANGNIRGSGTDDVGAYDIIGNYSTTDTKMELTKQYKVGTGDPYENLGHKVKIDLKWNDSAQEFDGQWTVHTAKYHGQDKFALKLRQKIETV